MKKKERGDVVLILTIGTLVVLGVSSLVSVFLPKANQSTKAKAGVDYGTVGCTGCEGKRCVWYDPKTMAAKVAEFCKDDNPRVNECTDENQACLGDPGPAPAADKKCPGKVDMDGACNPACCDPKIEDSYKGQKCVVYNGFCQSGFSTSPTSRIKRECRSNVCAWTFCTEGETTGCCEANNLGDDANKLTDADVKTCSTCFDNNDCVAVNPSQAPQGTGKCFNLTADVVQEEAKGGRNFNVTLNINNVSNKGGDVLMKPPSGQIRKNPVWAHSTFQYYPEWTDSPIFVPNNGRSVTVSYWVKLDVCGDLGNENTLTCLFSVDKALNPYSSCGLKNPPTGVKVSPPPGGPGTGNAACKATNITDENQCKAVTAVNCSWYSVCRACRENGTANDVACPGLPCSTWNTTEGTCGNTTKCTWLSGKCVDKADKVTTPTCDDCYGLLKGAIIKKGGYLDWTRDTVSVYVIQDNKTVMTIPNVKDASWAWSATGTAKNGPKIHTTYTVVGKLLQPNGTLRKEVSISVQASSDKADLVFDDGGAAAPPGTAGDHTYYLTGALNNSVNMTDWSKIKVFLTASGGETTARMTPTRVTDKLAKYEINTTVKKDAYDVLGGKITCDLTVKDMTTNNDIPNTAFSTSTCDSTKEKPIDVGTKNFTYDQAAQAAVAATTCTTNGDTKCETNKLFTCTNSKWDTGISCPSGACEIGDNPKKCKDPVALKCKSKMIGGLETSCPYYGEVVLPVGSDVIYLSRDCPSPLPLTGTGDCQEVCIKKGYAAPGQQQPTMHEQVPCYEGQLPSDNFSDPNSPGKLFRVVVINKSTSKIEVQGVQVQPEGWFRQTGPIRTITTSLPQTLAPGAASVEIQSSALSCFNIGSVLHDRKIWVVYKKVDTGDVVQSPYVENACDTRTAIEIN